MAKPTLGSVQGELTKAVQSAIAEGDFEHAQVMATALVAATLKELVAAVQHLDETIRLKTP